VQLIEFFDRGVRINPDGIAFMAPDGSEAMTYTETSEFSHRVGGALRRDGLGPGSRVAVLSANSTRMFPLILGIRRAGGIWVHLNARSTAPDLVAMLELVQCEAVLYSEEFVETMDAIRAGVPTVQHVISVDGDEAAFEAWLAPAGTRLPYEPLDAEGIVSLTGTGGTTGRPKAVALSNRAFETMIHGFQAHMPDAHPVHLAAAPLTHAAGTLVETTLAHGGVNIIHHSAAPGEILESIERNRVTRLFLPPTAIYGLLAHPDARTRDLSSLRHFLYAAAPMSVDKLKEALTIFGPVMAQCFGQAEAPMIATFLGTEEHAEALSDPLLEHRLASCGRPSLVANVAIMDDEGVIQPTGARGEIVVRSALNMTCYLDDPVQTEAAQRPGGWHATGDVGYQDPDGYVYIVDRKRDVIITGGFNVFPSEVEQVIWADPAVNDCAVIGLPDDKWGEQVTAVVELKDGADGDEDAIIAECKRRLGSVKAPKQVIFRDLPRSPVGKVLKRALRDEYWAGRARQV
jgi:acyl-CoA synthetase (AMP-forming)/AMP-acid ligase II